MSRRVRPLTDAELAEAERLIEEVAAEHGLSAADIIAKSRRQDITQARAAAVYRLWSTTDLTLRDIANVVGVKDHSSVCYLRNVHFLRASGVQ